MKFVLGTLQIGDVVKAEVHEVLSRDECILSIGGDLIRVRNESFQPLKKGDETRVRVIQMNPLQFKIVAAGSERGLLKLDRQI